MIDYKNKYSKYKNKYLELKRKQENKKTILQLGGSDKQHVLFTAIDDTISGRKSTLTKSFYEELDRLSTDIVCKNLLV